MPLTSIHYARYLLLSKKRQEYIQHLSISPIPILSSENANQHPETPGASTPLLGGVIISSLHYRIR